MVVQGWVVQAPSSPCRNVLQELFFGEHRSSCSTAAGRQQGNGSRHLGIGWVHFNSIRNADVGVMAAQYRWELGE